MPLTDEQIKEAQSLLGSGLSWRETARRLGVDRLKLHKAFDPERFRSYSSKSYNKHRTRRIAESRAWSVNNSDKRRVIEKRYKDNHREAIHEKHAAYYKANSERINDKVRAYQEANRGWFKDYQKRYNVSNAAKIKSRARERLCGVTQEMYDAALADQANACAICFVKFDTLESKMVHTDHDHVTGAFRGVLCSKCNKGLGMFKDEADRLRRAADYLERSKMLAKVK